MNDHERLRALLQRYRAAADERDVATLTAIFHSDATIEGSRGVQTLSDWLDTMRAPRPFPVSMHMLGDPLIDLDDDIAHLDTYAVVYQLGDANAGQGDLTLGIRYRDRVERGEAGWQIRARVAQTLWIR